MARVLRFVAWTALVVGVILGIGRLTVIRWWQVPIGDPYLEASIAPNLHGGDWIILWRGTAPKVGNLVLCPEPKADRQVVARIVGEQGDHVVATAGALVNNQPFDNEGSCDAFKSIDPGSGLEVTQGCTREVINKLTHQVGNVVNGLAAPKAASEDVRSGQLFLVSDNHQFPWDSREFGTVARASCTETVVFRVVSKNGFFDVANRLSVIR